MSDRILRVNALIKRELSQIFLTEVDFPRGVLVTITKVETSANLKEVKVYISVMPDSKSSRISGILNKIIYGIQQNLNKRLMMRPIPRIRFEIEQKTKEAAKIEELLEKVKNEEKLKKA